jgi:aldehyde dehydrogenase (NAD+)
VVSYIERGIADGATLVTGGPGPVEGLERGAYVKPTIFADVDPDSVIAQEEIFGPVLAIIPCTDDDQPWRSPKHHLRPQRRRLR